MQLLYLRAVRRVYVIQWRTMKCCAMYNGVLYQTRQRLAVREGVARAEEVLRALHRDEVVDHDDLQKSSGESEDAAVERM